jgi:tetratricopeptide (TPR) repeat protein
LRQIQNPRIDGSSAHFTLKRKTNLKDKIAILKIACVSAFVAVVCGVKAQTYQLGPDSSKDSQAQPNQNRSSGQTLGWGSNIQNARLARAAQLALQHGDRALALDYARRASQAAPNDPQLWFLLGYAARLNGRYQESVDAYTQGLHLSPASLDGMSGLAQDYSLMGRREDAERLFKQVLSSDPRRKEDALLLGEMYMKSKDYAGALDWLNRAEQLRPDARSELLLAISNEQLNHMDAANHYLDLARHRDPNNPEVQRSLAGYYRESARYSDAIAALKSIRNPNPDVQAELAYTYELDGRMSDSARVYAQAANAAPKDLTLQLSAAQAEVSAGSIHDASPFLERAEGLDAHSYRLHAIRGEIARSQERDEDAVGEYKAALAALPAIPAEGPLYGIQLRMDLVQLDQKLRDDDSAQQQLKVAQTEISALSEANSADGPFLRLRALIRMTGGDLDGALGDVKQALALHSRDCDDLQLDGDILMKLGRTEDAIGVYKQILDVDPANRFALTSLGYASRAAGRDEDAERYFHRLAQADPSSYVPYLALGDLYTSRREFTQAQGAYSNGYAAAPGQALIVAGGMNAAIESHNLDLAGEWLSRVTPEMQEHPQVLREKERYLSFKGEYQQSAQVAAEAIQALPRDRDVVVYLGYDLLHLQKYQDLLALTSKYNAVLPKEPDIPLLAGYVHKHDGLREQARQDFTEALDRDPDVETAYVNRGYMLNDLHQPEAAAADFDSALKREPNDGEAHLGLAYADLELKKPQAALRQAQLAEQSMGDSRDVHVIRATAYGREDLLAKAAVEYRSALKFTPNDAALHLGLGNALFAERRYHDAIDELLIAEKSSPEAAETDALLARSYANLQNREETLQYVRLAELHASSAPPPANDWEEPIQSSILVSTGEALSTLGDEKAAMDRFRRALETPKSNRLGVRLAIAQLMEQQNRSDDAERQIALAMMEAKAGETSAPSGSQFIAAADVFRGVHEYQLSQNYLERAKSAGAPDAEVRIGMANNYLALGDTTRAKAELAAVNASADDSPDYQYLLAQANVYRQEHQDALALTSFAQASNAEGEDQSGEDAMLQAGANEGLRITPDLSLLSDFSVEPIFEDTTVYVLDSKLDAPSPVPSSDTSLLPPPRSSLQTQWTDAFHLHLGSLPTGSGFFQVRNARGLISVPSTSSIVDRDTTDYTMNFALNPTVRLGNNVLQFNSGVQETIRRDSESPVAMNQNLFRVFTYLTTSSFFNTISVSGYGMRESGPFTESNLHSRALTGAVDFRVGQPWGKTALVTGWGANDQLFTPENFENYYTSSYVGIDRRFGERLDVKALAEDVRAWRVVGKRSGIAQNLRPAGTVDFTLKRNWDLQASTAYSSTRSFHVYDAIQSGFSVSYGLPVHRKFNDESREVVLQYPIRFAAGMQQETFFNFTSGHSQQLRPYVGITIF